MDRWLRTRGALFLASFFIILSCSNPLPRAKDTVVIGIRADLKTLNELNAADTDALQIIQHMLFMPLTRLDTDLNFTPWLAERWEFSELNTVLTYFLRDDVFWTDGAKTTAADVLFTYEIATNPDVAYPAASRFDLIDHIDMVDERTVRVHLKKAYPDILYDMQIPILPKHILGDLPVDSLLTSSFNRQPVGNGPFQLSEWKANQAIIFEANKNFCFGAPNLQRVVFSIIPDENMLLTNLQNGTIDLMPRLTPENSAQIKSPNIVVESFAGKNFTFIGWNLKRTHLTRRVRRALSYAINKNEIIESLLGGYGHPANGPLTPMAWAFDNKLQDLEFDIELAQQLLQAEGWRDSDKNGIIDKNGTPFELSLKVNSDSRLRQDVAVLVQAQLKNIGVKVNIERVEWNLFIEHIFQNADFDAMILAWDSDFTVNPTPLWHSDAIANGYNFVSYVNPRVDELLTLGRNAADQQRAQPYWSEFQQIIIDDCPYTFLFIQDNIVAYNKRLQGCEFDVRSLYVNIHEWSIN
jgi:peptide/nickel transport system substrate-binding protein